MTSGVNIGGQLDATTTGFGAFYVASPQKVNFSLLFGNTNYSGVGSGALTLSIDSVDSTGKRVSFWEAPQ